jgi:hypothetical protein
MIPRSKDLMGAGILLSCSLESQGKQRILFVKELRRRIRKIWFNEDTELLYSTVEESAEADPAG